MEILLYTELALLIWSEVLWVWTTSSCGGLTFKWLAPRWVNKLSAEDGYKKLKTNKSAITRGENPLDHTGWLRIFSRSRTRPTSCRTKSTSRITTNTVSAWFEQNKKKTFLTTCMDIECRKSHAGTFWEPKYFNFQNWNQLLIDCGLAYSSELRPAQQRAQEMAHDFPTLKSNNHNKHGEKTLKKESICAKR